MIEEVPLMNDFPLLTKPSLSLSCIYNVLLFICSALGPPLWCQVRPKEYILGILQISSAHNLFLQSLHLRPSNMTQTVNKPCNTVKLCTITGPYTVCLPSLMSVKFALLTLWKLLSSFILFWWTRHLFLISVTLVHLTLPTLSWVAIKGHQ